MKGKIRMGRISSEIKKNIAIILQYKVRDPRVVGIVTVLGIDVAKDLSCAKIFVTFLDVNITVDQLNKKIKILCGASGFIRSTLAKLMFLRVVPELFFIYDNSSMKKGMRVYRLLTQPALCSNNYYHEY